MAIKQRIWSLDRKHELQQCTNHTEADIEALFFEQIETLDPEWLVIGQQVVTDYGGRIDLLCMDSGGDLVVVELKKGMTPREITAQAIDYVSWVSSLTADRIAQIYESQNDGKTIDAAYKDKYGRKLDDDNINTNSKIVIVATEMDNSTERIIRYLNGYNLDINVLFFQVFEHRGERLVSRAWMIEESEEQSIKAQARSLRIPWNGEFYSSFSAVDGERNWEDAVKYGFISAGGGTWYSGTLYNLELGSQVWVSIPQTGYVGVGEVIETAQPCNEAIFVLNGVTKSFYEIEDLKGKYLKGVEDNRAEHLVKVEWLHTVPEENAVRESGFFDNGNTICKPTNSKWKYTLERLSKLWGIE